MNLSCSKFWQKINSNIKNLTNKQKKLVACCDNLFYITYVYITGNGHIFVILHSTPLHQVTYVHTLSLKRTGDDSDRGEDSSSFGRWSGEAARLCRYLTQTIGLAQHLKTSDADPTGTPGFSGQRLYTSAAVGVVLGIGVVLLQ